MKKIQIVHPEAVSLQNFEPTVNEDVFVRPNGDTLMIVNIDEAMLIRHDEPLIIL